MTSTGAKLELSTNLPTTEDVAGYDAVTGMTEIKGITSIGAFGASSALVESNQLADPITKKFKGQVNQGSVTVDAEFDRADAGQTLCRTAVEDVAIGGAAYTRRTFKLTYQTGDISYFQGKVFSATESPNGVNSMVTTSIQIEVETKIVRKAAA